MNSTFEIAFEKANRLISKKKESLLISHISNALSVIHETEFHKILDYLRERGVNITNITDLPDDNDKIKVYYIKKGTVIDSHTHKFNEFYICLFGKVKINTLGTSHIINSFETFKVDKFISHSIEILDDTFLVIFAQ